MMLELSISKLAGVLSTYPLPKLAPYFGETNPITTPLASVTVICAGAAAATAAVARIAAENFICVVGYLLLLIDDEKLEPGARALVFI